MTSDSRKGIPRRPTLQDLGEDLTRLPSWRRWCSIMGPFAWSAGYWGLACHGYWVSAGLCLVALSFVTYGSVSHDLVHRNLGLMPWVNDRLLVLIELLALRSGTAYRLAHLHHHRRFPGQDDIEGAAARMSLAGALAEGVNFQVRIFVWAWRNHPDRRSRLRWEGGIILLAYVASLAALPWTVVPFAYAVLLTVGAWVIPLVTSYLPHRPDAVGELNQTRAFRGALLSILAFEHLYHLEHHCYPAVPHHHWPKLARRLDPFFRAAGVIPIRLWL